MRSQDNKRIAEIEAEIAEYEDRDDVTDAEAKHLQTLFDELRALQKS